MGMKREEQFQRILCHCSNDNCEGQGAMQKMLIILKKHWNQVIPVHREKQGWRGHRILNPVNVLKLDYGKSFFNHYIL